MLWITTLASLWNMKNITVSIDDEMHRATQIRAEQLGASVSDLVRDYLRSLAGGQLNEPAVRIEAELRVRDLDEVIADFAAKGVGLRSSDNLTRDELYDEAINGPDAIR